jgi:D-serine deaminase-like pyridoxal phosphate-dependent protein
VYERNLDCMAASLAGAPVRLRPHAKTHKCPDVAQLQIARGAVGVCCPEVTINLYDWYVCVRRGRGEALWPIAARGAVL